LIPFATCEHIPPLNVVAAVVVTVSSETAKVSVGHVPDTAATRPSILTVWFGGGDGFTGVDGGVVGAMGAGVEEMTSTCEPLHAATAKTTAAAAAIQIDLDTVHP
jgi:hypothetical protein